MPTIDEYKGIAAEYKTYLDAESENYSNISFWDILRNFFTGTFYRGRFSRYIIWDWLAGGVKSNFLFKWLPKSEHANFIFLIDHICKLDRDANKLLEDISNVYDQDFHGLICLLMDYFTKIQEQCNKRLASYNEIYSDDKLDKSTVKYNREIIKEYYAKTLRNLKKNINNLAQQHGVLRRIKKNNRTSEEGLIIYSVEKLNWDYYENENYARKMANRAIATSNKRWAKVISFLSGIAEAFINYVAVKTLLLKVFAISLTLLNPWTLITIPFIVTGLYTHYSFYRQGLYDGLKEIRRGNFFKELSKEDGDYKEISCKKKGLATVFSLLSVGGGFCGWAITSFSVSTALMGSLCISGTLIALPFAAALAFGLTFVYYRSIGKVIKKLDEDFEKFKKYVSNIKKGEDVPRVILDIVVLALAIVVMITLGIVGYRLFRGKGINILQTWHICHEASALIISSGLAAINSCVKGFFGVKKICELVNKFIEWMQFSEPASGKSQGVSAVTNSLSVPPDNSLYLEKSNLNPIQAADQSCVRKYKWISYLSVFFNATAKGALYGTSGENPDNKLGADSIGIGACEFFYMGAPTAVATAHRIGEDNAQIDNRYGFKRYGLFSQKNEEIQDDQKIEKFSPNSALLAG